MSELALVQAGAAPRWMSFAANNRDAMDHAPSTRVDYGGLEEVSRKLNRMLGDRTGRTVTQRTQDGLAAMTNGRLDLDGCETHALMLATAACLASRNKALTLLGLGGLAFLTAGWLHGEHGSARNDGRSVR